MKPPTGGPITGPISAGTVSQASEPTSSRFSTDRRITSRPTGTIMAPPIPWMMRAPTSVAIELEKPQRIEPMVKIAIAARKTLRAPCLSASQPEAGRKTAMARR